jgi:hypothetical protein
MNCGSAPMRNLQRILFPVLLLFSALAPLAAAINCELNDPASDVPRLFPESSSYKVSGFSFAAPGSEGKLPKVEARLGGVPSLYAPLNVPYTLYVCYKGPEKIGYVHGVNQKGQFGVLEVFVSLDLHGRIKAFYLQRIAGQWGSKFTSAKFGKQFLGLTLKDFETYDFMGGKGSGKLAAIVNPAPEALTDFLGLLRALNKNLILMDEFIYTPEKANP